MKYGTFTTGLGKQFKITPSSPFQIEQNRLAFTELFKADNPEPKQPTYRTETAGGGFEELPMDKTSAETPEQIAEVEAYDTYFERQNGFVGTKMIDAFIVENVVAEPLADTAWTRKKKVLGIKLPEDDIELKLYYVREHLLFNDEDGGDLSALPMAVAQLSGVRQQAVAAGKATFRNSLRKQRRGANARPDSGEFEEGQEPLVYGGEISGANDGEILALDAE